MNPRYQPEELVELTELSSFSDENDDTEDSPANYVLSASKQEIFRSSANDWMYINSNVPLTESAQKAREMTTSLDIDQASCFSPRSEVELQKPTQIVGCEPRIKLGDGKNLGVSPAINDYQSLLHSARPVNEVDEDSSASDLCRKIKAPSAADQEYLSAVQDEIQESPILQQRLLMTSEMKGRLKQECCMGIGSWSKDGITTFDKAEKNAADPVHPEIYAMFDKSWLADVKQCPTGQWSGQRQQPSRTPDTQAQDSVGPSSSTFAAQAYELFQRGEPEGDESDDEVPKRGARKDGPDGHSETTGPRLACPFNKHDPYFFNANNINGSTFRCCGGPGFEDIARVK